MKTFAPRIEQLADDLSRMIADVGLRLLLILVAIPEFYVTLPITHSAATSIVISIGGIGAIHTTVASSHLRKYRYMYVVSVLHFVLLASYVQWRADVLMVCLVAVSIIVATTYARVISEIKISTIAADEEARRARLLEDQAREDEREEHRLRLAAELEADRLKLEAANKAKLLKAQNGRRATDEFSDELPTNLVTNSAPGKLTKKERRQKEIATYLLTNYAGVDSDKITPKIVVDKFGIGRDTARKDIAEVWQSQNWNGKVGA